MAERTMTLTVADVRALGDRLFSRGMSRVTDDGHFKADLRTAARVIWRLVADYAPRETIEIPAGEG